MADRRASMIAETPAPKAMVDERTLYVTNLDDRVSEELLYELMIQAGPVESVSLLKNIANQLYAFVVFEDVVSVKYSIEVFHNVKLFGRLLMLKPRDIPGQQKQSRLIIGQRPMLSPVRLAGHFPLPLVWNPTVPPPVRPRFRPYLLPLPKCPPIHPTFTVPQQPPTVQLRHPTVFPFGSIWTRNPFGRGGGVVQVKQNANFVQSSNFAMAGWTSQSRSVAPIEMRAYADTGYRVPVVNEQKKAKRSLW